MKNVFLLSFRIIILLELAPLHYCRLLGVIGPVPRPLSIRAYLFFLIIPYINDYCQYLSKFLKWYRSQNT